MADSQIAHDPLDVIASNSFRNFHALGLDYLCLLRSPALTVKAYFYEQEGMIAPELVCPHDHRYPFTTTVIAGECDHFRYLDTPDWLGRSASHQRFAWRTPLNGGDGFHWDGEARLERVSHERYGAGKSYWCQADEIHTISPKPGTILLLCQMADVLPVGEPTWTFVRGDGKEPPNLDGLYDQMPLSRAEVLLARVNATLTPTKDSAHDPPTPEPHHD